jgi:Sec-independent protein secretion pathway component TatC
MSVGILEVALLLLVTAAVLLAVLKTGNPYLWGIAGLCAVAVICSPPDLFSTLLIAVPTVGIYGFAIGRLSRGDAE